MKLTHGTRINISALIMSLVLSPPISAVSISLVATPGADGAVGQNGRTAERGGDGGDGEPLIQVLENGDSINRLTLTGGDGGRGGNGGNGVPIIGSGDESTGGDGGKGGNGGAALATLKATTQSDTTSTSASAFSVAQGGDGAQGGNAGQGTGAGARLAPPDDGQSGDGGFASASTTAINTGIGNSDARATAIGGNGGDKSVNRRDEFHARNNLFAGRGADATASAVAESTSGTRGSQAVAQATGGDGGRIITFSRYADVANILYQAGDGGSVDLVNQVDGSMGVSQSGSALLSLTQTATGGKGGASTITGDRATAIGGNGGNSRSLVTKSADGFGTRVRAVATGGDGGFGRSSGGNGGEAEAHSEARVNSLDPNRSLTAEATAIAEGGNAGRSSNSAGQAGRAKATAIAISEVGDATASATQIGGNGSIGQILGVDPSGTGRSDGADSIMVNAVSGSATGTLRLSQTAIGGDGFSGANSFTANGGDAVSSLTTSNPGGGDTTVVTVRAEGGDVRRAPTPNRIKAGDADASLRLTVDTPDTAVFGRAEAIGGNAGFDQTAGDAVATTEIIGGTRSRARAIAINGKSMDPSGIVFDEGKIAASAKIVNGKGNAGVESNGLGLGPFTRVQVNAEALGTTESTGTVIEATINRNDLKVSQANSVISTTQQRVARQSIAAAPIPSIGGKGGAATHFEILPGVTQSREALSGSPGILGANEDILALMNFSTLQDGTFNQAGFPAFSNSIGFGVEALQADLGLDQGFLFGLFDPVVSGNGFDSLRINIFGFGETIVDETFTNVDEALNFFSDNTFTFPELQLATRSTFGINVFTELSGVGDGFSFGAALGTTRVPELSLVDDPLETAPEPDPSPIDAPLEITPVPEPSSILLFSLSLIFLGFVIRRRNLQGILKLEELS